MSEIYLHAYDISGGLAAQFSQALIGKRIEAIWHTGIVVYGREYYYGDGISSDPPKRTPFGNPTKVIHMGQTEIPKELFMEYLQEISPHFTYVEYNIINYNCNNFTNTVAEFVLGKGIPEEIINLPQDLLSTPLGKMMEPIISQMTTNLKSMSHPETFLPPGEAEIAPSIDNPPRQQLPPMATGPGLPSNISDMAYQLSDLAQGRAPQVPLTQPSAPMVIPDVLEINSITQLDHAKRTYFGLILDVWSPSCPPCIMFKPKFQEMASGNKYKEIKFCTVNSQACKPVAISLGIQAVPSFFIYFKGELVSKFEGASEQNLRYEYNSLCSLVDSCSPHAPEELKTVVQQGLEELKPHNLIPTLYESVGSIENMHKNLTQQIMKIQVKELIPQGVVDFKAVFGWIKDLDVKEDLHPDILKDFMEIFSNTEPEERLGFTDALRLLILNENNCALITSQYWEKIVTFLIKPALKGDLSIGKLQNLLIIIMRFLNNMFASDAGINRVYNFSGNKTILTLIMLVKKALETKNPKIISPGLLLLYHLRLFALGDNLVEIQKLSEQYVDVCLNTPMEESKEVDIDIKIATCIGLMLYKCDLSKIKKITHKEKFTKWLEMAKVLPNQKVRGIARDIIFIIDTA